MVLDPPGESWRDAALLLDMALAAEDALSFVAGLDEHGFLASDLHQSAVIRKLEIMGEAAGKVSKSFCAAHPQIPWTQMTGLRHRLIHGYGDVRLDIVWRVATETLPGLVAVLRARIPPPRQIMTAKVPSVSVSYTHNGSSTTVNAFGMRPVR